MRPFELGIKVAPDFAYFLVYPEAVKDDARVVAFREWLTEEAARTPT